MPPPVPSSRTLAYRRTLRPASLEDVVEAGQVIKVGQITMLRLPLNRRSGVWIEERTRLEEYFNEMSPVLG